MTHKLIYNSLKLFNFLLVLLLLSSCNTSTETIYLVHGEHANDVEIATVIDLEKDLKKLTDTEIKIIEASENLPNDGVVFLLGTVESNSKIQKNATLKKINLSASIPGSRGGIWAKVSERNGKETIILAGSDVQGLQYAIYDYTHDVLGIDPFEYWTDKTPERNPEIDLFDFENRQITPPEIPILCYFENDVDELANYRGTLLEYDWESYTEMINSLVRIRYNAIQLFDMLGRPEFFLREPYKKLRPDYDIDLDYIEKLIDYAHLKGMDVQIDMSLGYKIFQLEAEEASCWKENKDKWLKAWSYYFEETPIGKCDIFSLRPRNQVWDWEYKSTCGEDKTEVFNEVYAEFGKLVDKYKPDATKIVICYHDGMEMFNEGFNPPKDFIVAWSDDGWVKFKHLPESNKGYDFGSYMHAGFWKNHTVHNPCPELIDETMTHFIPEYEGNKYLQVNGQTFRLFLLNLEAFSEVAQSYKDFDGEVFYKEWTSRYFGEGASKYVIAAFKKLHQAQLEKNGYVDVLHSVRMLHMHLKNNDLTEESECYQSGFRSTLDQRIVWIDEAWNFAQQGKAVEKSKADFYYDHVELPILLVRQLLDYQQTLESIAIARDMYLKTGEVAYKTDVLLQLENAYAELQELIDTSLEGDRNPKWANWYNPTLRRPNNGFPTLEDLREIINNNKIL